MKNALIIGGGISGLITAILLSRAGIDVLLVERKHYPLNRVCGEYISNEAMPFLKSIGAFPEKFSPSQISRLQLSSISGDSQTIPLEMGGFGISRFVYDKFLYDCAKSVGVGFMLDTDVTSVDFMGQSFKVRTANGDIDADIVVGGYGKRSKLDISRGRDFTRKRSPFVGVKYHVRADHPKDLIALHNFPEGYCGICAVENEIINVCYLSHRDNLKRFRSIEEMEKNVLATNPLLKEFLSGAEKISERAETINEISFSPKTSIEDHMIMIGDAAGMITPLCGNGMAMAIHSAKLASEQVIRFIKGQCSREEMEKSYEREWSYHFSKRLWSGRQIQKLFGSPMLSRLAIGLILYSKPLAGLIIRNTHGKTF